MHISVIVMIYSFAQKYLFMERLHYHMRVLVFDNIRMSQVMLIVPSTRREHSLSIDQVLRI